MAITSTYGDETCSDDEHLRSIAHCMSIKTAFAACRKAVAEYSWMRPVYRRALKRRVRVLKQREAQSEMDMLANLKARHDNYMDSIAADLGLGIVRYA